MFEFAGQNPSVIAAFLSAIATIFAALAAWRGPKSAASLAEKLRQNNEKENEKRRMKLFIFTTLMQERASLASRDSVRVLNLIDVVFNESREIREAWSELFITFDPARKIPDHIQEDRLRALLQEMAKDIGLSDGLRLDDLSRVYYPNSIAEEELLRLLERRAALARLQGGPSATANTAAPASTLWPPKP